MLSTNFKQRVRTINYKSDLNDYITSILRRLVSDEDDNVTVDKSFLQTCFSRQLLQSPSSDIKLNAVWYGPKQRNLTTVYDFWIGKKNIAVGDFWMGSFLTDFSHIWLAGKHGLTIPMAQSVVQCVSCILSGYQCIIDPNCSYPPWRKVWPRNFNLYLSRRHKYINSDQLWIPEIAMKRFCRQFPDTEYNREAISHIEYGLVNTSGRNIWGLKLNGSPLLLSQLVFSYLDYLVFKEVRNTRYYVGGEGYRNCRLSYDEFKECMYLIYAIISGFDTPHG